MSRVSIRRALAGTAALAALAVPLSKCGDSDGCVQAICAAPGGEAAAPLAVDAP